MTRRYKTERNLPSLEQIAKRYLEYQYDARLYGFAEAFRVFAEKRGLPRTEYTIDFVPDAWRIDEDAVFIWEVEHTHPLTVKKLVQLCKFYMLCEEIDTPFVCYTTDLYGRNPASLDLQGLWYAIVEADLKTVKTVRVA